MAQNLNAFQKYLTRDPRGLEAIKEIVRLFHPDVSDEDLTRLRLYTKYDWVCITYKGINLGIEFYHKLWGSGKTISDFEEAYREKGNWRAWRFVDDCKTQRLNIRQDDDLKDKITPIMNKYNVHKPSPKQMFDYYYHD